MKRQIHFIVFMISLVFFHPSISICGDSQALTDSDHFQITATDPVISGKISSESLTGSKPETSAGKKIDPFQISVSVEPEQIRIGESGVVRFFFQIAPEHYLYANQTKVKAEPVPGIVFQPLIKPKGDKKTDPYIGTVFTYKENVELRLPFNVDYGQPSGKKSISLVISYQGCTADACMMPQEKRKTVEFTLIPGSVVSSGEKTDNSAPESMDRDNPFQKMHTRFGMFGVLIAAFFWGFLASLTPCIYPMIPVTVSVIGAGRPESAFRGFILSVFYVLGMSLTYAVFGLIAAWTGGLFGEYSSHPIVRIIVSALFFFLALGMFDVYYLQVPSSISSKFSGSRGTGPIGVFLTGAIAGAVVGPCVGPMLVGLLVYIASIGNPVTGFFIMWAFALGMGILFLLIGTFSGVAMALPKSGTWMVSLKKFFGLVMLGLSIYYIEPVLSRQVFFLVLGGFLIGLGVFSGGLDPLTPESDGKNRLKKSIGILLIVLGVSYASLFVYKNPVMTPMPSGEKTEQGIAWEIDEAAVLSRANREGKPVMIDFYADWCAACVKLERTTFADSAVIKMSKQFENLRIDCTDVSSPEVKRLKEKYHVIGLPTIIFLDPDGNVIEDRTLTQYMDPTDLMKNMETVLRM